MKYYRKLIYTVTECTHWQTFLKGGRNVLRFALLLALVVGLYICLKVALSKPRPVTQNNLADQSSGERVALLEDAQAALDLRLDLIEQAEEYIDLSYYSFMDEASHKTFLAALWQAADRGIHIRILIDGLQEGGDYGRPLLSIMAIHPGIEFAYFNPPRLSDPLGWNHRLHEKIFLVDGRYLIIGGRNLGTPYFSNEAVDNPKLDRDIFMISQKSDSGLLKIIGQHYEELWQSPYCKRLESLRNVSAVAAKTLEEHPEIKDLRNRKRPEAGTCLEKFVAKAQPVLRAAFVCNGSEKENKSALVWQAFLDLAKDAREIVVQSPYLCLDTHMKRDLKQLMMYWGKYPPDVKILTNSACSAVNFFGEAATLNTRRILQNYPFVNFYEYLQTEASIHAKSFLIDNRYAAVGSFNFDPRSTYLHLESMLIVECPALVQELRDAMEDKMQDSRVFTTEQPDPAWHAISLTKRLAYSVGRIIASLFRSMI